MTRPAETRRWTRHHVGGVEKAIVKGHVKIPLVRLYIFCLTVGGEKVQQLFFLFVRTLTLYNTYIYIHIYKYIRTVVYFKGVRKFPDERTNEKKKNPPVIYNKGANGSRVCRGQFVARELYVRACVQARAEEERKEEKKNFYSVRRSRAIYPPDNVSGGGARGRGRRLSRIICPYRTPDRASGRVVAKRIRSGLGFPNLLAPPPPPITWFRGRNLYNNGLFIRPCRHRRIESVCISTHQSRIWLLCRARPNVPTASVSRLTTGRRNDLVSSCIYGPVCSPSVLTAATFFIESSRNAIIESSLARRQVRIKSNISPLTFYRYYYIFNMFFFNEPLCFLLNVD